MIITSKISCFFFFIFTDFLNHIHIFMGKCVGVEWELEQICEVSLLTNRVIKVVHSCLKSHLE